MDIGVVQLAVAAFAGLACGFLNTVASSGSAVSLPILMWLGLPAIDANATNRLPVLIGSVVATTDLALHRKIPWRLALKASVPTTIGAALGALVAEVMPDKGLRLVIVLAVAFALLLILTKLKSAVERAVTGEARFGLREALLFAVIGIWLGFIVLDGATYLLLGLVLAARLPLVAANATKNLLLVPTTLVAMAIFASRGSIDWSIGGVMAAGSIAGGLIGARLAMSAAAKKWIVGLLVVVISSELVHLAIRYALTLLG